MVIKANGNLRSNYTKYDGVFGGLWGLLTPIIISFVLVIIYSIVASLAGVTNEEILQLVPVVYITNVLVELSFVAAFFIYNKVTNTNWVVASGIKQKTHYLNYAFAVVLGLALPLLFSPLISLWEQFLVLINYNMTSSLAIPLNNAGDLILALLTVAIIPAFCEELLFRGLVLNGLRGMGKWASILLSALIFALMHTSMEQLPYTFILGVVIGYIVYMTGSIWLGMIIHAVNNGLVVVSMYIDSVNGVDSAVTASAGWGDVGIAVLSTAIGVGVVILIFWLMHRFTLQKKDAISQNSGADTIVQGDSNINESNSSDDKKFVMVDGKPEPYTEVMDKKTRNMLIATIAVGVLLLLIDLITSFGV